MSQSARQRQRKPLRAGQERRIEREMQAPRSDIRSDFREANLPEQGRQLRSRVLLQMKAGRLFVKTPRDVVWPGDPVRGDADIDAAGLEDIEHVVNLLKRIIRMQMLHQLVAVGHVYRVALRRDAAAIRDDQPEICRDIRHVRDLGRDINGKYTRGMSADLKRERAIARPNLQECLSWTEEPPDEGELQTHFTSSGFRGDLDADLRMIGDPSEKLVVRLGIQRPAFLLRCRFQTGC